MKLCPIDGNDPPDGFADCSVGGVGHVPEPSRYLLLAAGLGCLMVLHRVNRRG
jgi:hypothetical protein